MLCLLKFCIKYFQKTWNNVNKYATMEENRTGSKFFLLALYVNSKIYLHYPLDLCKALAYANKALWSGLCESQLFLPPSKFTAFVFMKRCVKALAHAKQWLCRLQLHVLVPKGDNQWGGEKDLEPVWPWRVAGNEMLRSGRIFFYSHLWGIEKQEDCLEFQCVADHVLTR